MGSRFGFRGEVPNPDTFPMLVQEANLEDKLASAGGVPETIVTALGALLTSKELDGMFIASGISLPAATELIGSIPNIDPLLLHNVRCEQAPLCLSD